MLVSVLLLRSVLLVSAMLVSDVVHVPLLVA